VNPLDDPDQRNAYLADRQKEARAMLEQMKQERHGPAPNDRPKAIVIGQTGPTEGFSALDS
jgi:hypothetical protein